MRNLKKEEDMSNLREAVKNALNDNSIAESFRMFIDKYGTLAQANGNEKEWNNFFSTFYTSLGLNKRDAFDILNKI